MDINDAEFVDTVKAEYRSSSPSWAADSKKFKFPGGGEEKAVSVRKRMESVRVQTGSSNLQISGWLNATVGSNVNGSIALGMISEIVRVTSGSSNAAPTAEQAATCARRSTSCCPS